MDTNRHVNDIEIDTRKQVCIEPNINAKPVSFQKGVDVKVNKLIFRLTM